MALVGGYKHGSAVILDQKHDELCRLGLARITTNDMNVIRILIKALTGSQNYFFSASDPHYDGAFHHIDKSVRRPGGLHDVAAIGSMRAPRLESRGAEGYLGHRFHLQHRPRRIGKEILSALTL